MKKLKFLFTALFILTIASTQCMHSVLAISNIRIDVSTDQIDSNSVSGCPDSIISSDVLNVKVTNLAEYTDTIYLTLDWVDNAGFIVPEITLASGESKKIDPLWITIPYSMEPGTYTARIEARSATSGEKAVKDIKVQVLRCRSVDISIKENYKQTCSESPQPEIYQVSVTNNGKWDETFQLSADVDWASFSDSTVYLMPGNTKTVDLILSPKSTQTGRYKITVTAMPTDPRFSYIKDTETILLDVNDCYDFDVDVEPKDTRLCSGEETVFTLVIENTGSKKDTIKINAPEGVMLDEDSVTLDVAEKREINARVHPAQTGIINLTFEAVSSIDKNNIKKATATVSVNECRSYDIEQADMEKTACAGGFDQKFLIRIKNTGTVNDTISLSSTYGTFDKNSVTLSPGEEITVTLTAKSLKEEGAKNITVVLNDGTSLRKIEMRLISANCYTAEINAQPKIQYACPHTNAVYVVTIRNTGKMKDNFTLDYGIGRETLTLGAGETGTVNITIPIDFEESGVYVVQMRLTSENGLIDKTEKTTLNVKPMSECYSVRVIDGNATVKTGQAIGKRVYIKNTGEVVQTFNLTLDGPEWAYIKPTTTSISPGKNETVYVYISPLYATEPGQYKVRVMAKSKYALGSYDITVTVPPSEGQKQEEENITTQAQENETANASSQKQQQNVTIGQTGTNISLDVSIEGNESGAPITGMASEQSQQPSNARTIAIAIIALIIIIILTIRFILLFRG